MKHEKLSRSLKRNKLSITFYLPRKEVGIKVRDKVLVETCVLNSATKSVVTKFAFNYEGPYKVIEYIGSNIKIQKYGKIPVLNIDQVRVFNGKREYPDLIDGAITDEKDDPETAHENNSNYAQKDKRDPFQIIDHSMRSCNSYSSNNSHSEEVGIRRIVVRDGGQNKCSDNKSVFPMPSISNFHNSSYLPSLQSCSRRSNMNN